MLFSFILHFEVQLNSENGYSKMEEYSYSAVDHVFLPFSRRFHPELLKEGFPTPDLSTECTRNNSGTRVDILFRLYIWFIESQRTKVEDKQEFQMLTSCREHQGENYYWFNAPKVMCKSSFHFFSFIQILHAISLQKNDYFSVRLDQFVSSMVKYPERALNYINLLGTEYR